MRNPFKFFLSTLCLLSIFLFHTSYAADTTQDIISNAAQLAADAKDPYAASLPMMIYAELGDLPHYQTTKDHMLQLLNGLDTSTNSAWKWMQNNSFKAWMWGRILLAAQSIHDDQQMGTARTQLTDLLKQPATAADNAAFTTWAWGYLAALDKKEYQLSKKQMMDGAQALADKYQASGKPADLSDALWGWVMNIQAAARAHDRATYEKIKAKITGNESVEIALVKGLSHTAESNDYPAWALAKVRLAAATIGDQTLFLALKVPMEVSIAEAKAIATNGAKAEYAFAVLDNKLAEANGKK